MKADIPLRDDATMTTVVTETEPPRRKLDWQPVIDGFGAVLNGLAAFVRGWMFSIFLFLWLLSWVFGAAQLAEWIGHLGADGVLAFFRGLAQGFENLGLEGRV